jgi:hypothetical protein
MGRPSDYDPAICEKICERLAKAESLLKICEDSEMPGYSTIYQWKDKHPEFAEKLARAREDMADYISHQIIAIADEQDEDWTMTKFGPVFNKEAAARSRVRIDARLRMMQMLKPRSYDPAKKVELSGGVDIRLAERISAARKQTPE